jgi:hypothetical protein
MNKTSNFEIFHNCEILLKELPDVDFMVINGGKSNTYFHASNFEIKLLEYALVGFAISNIVSLVKLFLDTRQHR